MFRNVGSIALLMFVALSCKARNYNANGKTNETMVNPDEDTGEIQTCDKLLEQAPYSPEILANSIGKAVQNAAQDMGNHDTLASFLFRSQINDAMKDNVSEIKASIAGDSSCNTITLINKSLASPSQVFTLTYDLRDSFGGMVLFHGDVFAEGFYRTRAVNVPTQADFIRKPLKTAMDFKNNQPWFEWMPKSKSFVFHKSGAENRLLQHTLSGNTINGKYVLYRGTGSKYITPKSIYDSKGGSMSNFGEVVSQFSTPDRDTAVGWANPILVKFEISPEDIKKAVESSSNPLAYVGIEYTYIEVALFVKPTDSLSKRIIDSITPVCYKFDDTKSATVNAADAQALGLSLCK